MDSVFRWAREKLEKEHRVSKESGKLKLEREKKDKDAAERQRRAVEASQRARRLAAIEALMMKEDVIPRKGGNYIIPDIPPWISKKTHRIDHDELSKWDDEEGAEWEVGEAPGTVKFNEEEQEAEEAEKDERRRQRLLRKLRKYK